MSTPQLLRDNVPYYSRLISSIGELDYVPSALTHQTSYVNDLQTRLKQSEARLKKLSETTMKEKKEHELLRDSTARRLAHKLTGRKEKFDAMEMKEEREYVEALEKEFAERETHNVLINMAEEAKRENADLAEKAVHYEALKKELAQLYARVFDGPTEGYPEDDRLEYKLQSTQVLHDEIQNTLNAECRVCEILTHADQTLAACEAKVKEALGHSRVDIWVSGRSSGIFDMLERNALSKAQSLAMHTQNLCQQAQDISPFVQSIGPLPIAKGSIWGDVIFDNFFSDIAFHNKIQASAEDLKRAHSLLKNEQHAAQCRANNAGVQLIEVAQTLQVDRLSLDSYRQEVFQGISREVDASTTSDRPPNYDAASAQPAGSSVTEATPEEAQLKPAHAVQGLTPMATILDPAQSTSSSPSRWASSELAQYLYQCPALSTDTGNPYAAALATRSGLPSYAQS